MTDLATSRSIVTVTRRPRTVATIAAGLFGGAALGVIARAWMRLIAEDPAFSWSGTIFIVTAFTIFGFTQAIAAVVRRRARRRRTLTIARICGGVGMAPLFAGAGAIMLPTVVGAGLARSRTDWRRWTRVVCALVAAAPVTLIGVQLVDSFGWSPHALLGFLGMLAIYGTIVALTRYTMAPLADGWRLKSQVKIGILVTIALLTTLLLAGLR